MWLRDLLPNQISQLQPRISTFGYDSAVFSKSYSTVRDFSTQLLDEVHRMRREV